LCVCHIVEQGVVKAQGRKWKVHGYSGVPGGLSRMVVSGFSTSGGGKIESADVWSEEPGVVEIVFTREGGPER
jgi:hypothetical protein